MLAEQQVFCRVSLAQLPGPIPPKEILAEPMVGFQSERAPGLQEKIARALCVGLEELQFGQIAIQMQTIIGLVAAGYGLSVVPASMRNLERQEVVYREISGSQERATTYLLRNEHVAPVIEKFERVLTGR